MPSTTEVDFWVQMDETLDAIMFQKGMTYKTYMELYTSIYNYCTASRSHPPPLKKRKGYQSSKSNSGLPGYGLYAHLIWYLSAHLETIQPAFLLPDGETLLRLYVREWERYAAGVKYLSRVCSVLDRGWVAGENKEVISAKRVDCKGYHTVYRLALVQWKLHALPNAQGTTQRLTAAVLQQIEDERRGAVIDSGLLKQVVASLIAVGMDDRPTILAEQEDLGDPLALYKKHVEESFITATKQFYAAELAEFKATGDVHGYFKKLDARMRDEEDRIELYLAPCTRQSLLLEFIYTEHVSKVWDSLASLLDFDSGEDLGRMFSLLKRKPDGFDPMRKMFEEHVKKSGIDSIGKLVSGQGNIDPVKFVEAILKVYDKNSEIVEKFFERDSGFTASLDMACKYFINENAAISSSSRISPQLLAQYADILLRKRGQALGAKELEQALDGVTTVLKYINDRDVFQTFYTNSLCRRLLHGSSISEEAEAGMTAKLKEACGLEYSNKLMRMVTEVAISKDLSDSFQSSMELQPSDQRGVNFSVVILGANLWPLAIPFSGFEIPQDIIWTYERFSRFYGQRHQGRKLIWLWGHSRNEIRTNYLNEPYILSCSSHQMAVLMQYNDVETWSFNGLLATTSIHRDILVQILHGLVKAKLVVEKENKGYAINPGNPSA
ncbi:hypothetical protein FRB93_008293 [Tulasnella sp. JGI-2019a]|nr:hypothetical protein FRB93_008293 [Tulasnella sp. JGI-2019a]